MSNSTRLAKKSIVILATDGFEQSELFEPKEKLENMGANVTVVSINGNTSIKGWDQNEWVKKCPVDAQVEDVNVDDFDALVLPGGQMNPDLLRNNSTAVQFVRDAASSDNIKSIAAICHAPWMLIEADLVAGKNIASFPSIKKDVENAGASWVNRAVVRDGKLITSRNPDDIPYFVNEIADLVAG